MYEDRAQTNGGKILLLSNQNSKKRNSVNGYIKQGKANKSSFMTTLVLIIHHTNLFFKLFKCLNICI